MNKIKIIKIKPVHIDKRGSIADLLNKKVSHVGLIITKKGVVRANHYHKLSTQYSYILSGSFEVLTAKANSPSKVKRTILKEGDLMEIPPFTIHRFKALKKTVMIDIVSESRKGNSYEKDVFRVPDISQK